MDTAVATNDNVMPSLTDLVAVSKTEERYLADPSLAALDAVNFQPYIKLYVSESPLCKDEKFPVNHYGLHTSQSEVPEINLGREFTAFFLCWRKKAAELEGRTLVAVCYDETNPEYIRIAKKAAPGGLCGALEGLEWGVYLPDFDVCGAFHFANKSAKQVEPKYRSHKGKLITFKTRKIEPQGSTFKWTAVELALSDRGMPATYNRPLIEAFIAKFINPKDKLPLLAPVTDSVER